MRKINFSTKQVDAAAQFIFKNNHSMVSTHNIKDWEKVKEHILDHIRSVAALPMSEKLPYWTASGGWILVFEESEERTDQADCEVFVDASVSQKDSFLMDNFVGFGESNV